MGPRTALRESFDGNAGEPGNHILTPFVRDDGQRILVNRGWVPDERTPPATRAEGQVAGPVRLEAIVITPKQGKPNSFVPDNDPGRGQWFWVDVPALAEALGTSPIIVEAAENATPPGGVPLGGQSQVIIRNEHMQYNARATMHVVVSGS